MMATMNIFKYIYNINIEIKIQLKIQILFEDNWNRLQEW